MKARSLLLASLIALAHAPGCAQGKPGNSTSWLELKMETLELERVDPTSYEVLRFAPDGIVAATVGTKGGPLTGPVLHWRLEGDRLVISASPKSSGHDVLRDPRRVDDRLWVKRGPKGTVVEFIVRRRQ